MKIEVTIKVSQEKTAYFETRDVEVIHKILSTLRPDLCVSRMHATIDGITVIDGTILDYSGKPTR